jgi:hypothetical protein
MLIYYYGHYFEPCNIRDRSFWNNTDSKEICDRLAKCSLRKTQNRRLTTCNPVARHASYVQHLLCRIACDIVVAVCEVISISEFESR